MLVYRVENRHGEGPYRSSGNNLGDYAYCEHAHPEPMEDGMVGTGRFSRNLHFGFKSLIQLQEWFLTDMRKHVFSWNEDFAVSVYDFISPSACVFGNKQLAFPKRQGKLVNKLHLLTFEPIKD